jgi:holo-[acyl-carrier protein] synthase
MIHVGVDMIELERIERMLERYGDRFLQRVYTPAEIACCRGRVSSLAARWAAKEAVSKALGTGWRGISWTDIEVTRHSTGQPSLVLHDRAVAAAKRLGITYWSVSFSHSTTTAIAMVVGLCARSAGL